MILEKKMKNIREYKFKNSFLNYFFWQNRIFFVKAEETNDKIMCTEIEYKNEKNLVLIFDEKFKDIKNSKMIRKLVFDIVAKMEIPDYIYTNTRCNFNLISQIILSEKMSLILKPITFKLKNSLIVYNYFKIKELIETQGYNNFYEQYKVAGINENTNQVLNHMRGPIEDYFFICSLKNIIRIYKKEVDYNIDIQNPSFKDKMLFEYLNNYFRKLVIIDYNEEKVKKFISNYYVTETQSEDLTFSFIGNFLSFYKFVTKSNFSYKKKFQYKIESLKLFNAKKSKNVKCPNYYKYFDKVMEKTENLKNFMFMLEFLELNEYVSKRKKIINYISTFELLLVKGDRHISIQLQKKVIDLLKINNYSYDELKLAYDYRSKIIHGEYAESLTKLHQLLQINDYSILDKEVSYDSYLNLEQLIEEKLSERMCELLRVVLWNFIFRNDFLSQIKSIE